MATRRNNRKWLWWGIGILVVAVTIVAVVLIVKNNTKDESTYNERGQSETKESEKKEEKKEEPEKTKEETTSQKEEVKQYDGEDPNTVETLTGVISYAGVSGGKLLIRVNIDQYLSNGSCKLALTRDGVTIYNSTAAIESSVSTSTCNGFDVPVSEIGNGNFKIEVTLESDNKYGKIAGEVAV
ncbi:hypothetical protein IJG93_00980 [Candidatus Saccharibacteria bacterium]|nr:hypothetical protein [Candidatus Saccharibacteria bacterium]MBR0424031.1 hypothetical protein [Candidatus Saccharibacteria bacterium]